MGGWAWNAKQTPQMLRAWRARASIQRDGRFISCVLVQWPNFLRGALIVCEWQSARARRPWLSRKASLLKCPFKISNSVLNFWKRDWHSAYLLRAQALDIFYSSVYSNKASMQVYIISLWDEGAKIGKWNVKAIEQVYGQQLIG